MTDLPVSPRPPKEVSHRCEESWAHVVLNEGDDVLVRQCQVCQKIEYAWDDKPCIWFANRELAGDTYCPNCRRHWDRTTPTRDMTIEERLTRVEHLLGIGREVRL